MAQPSNRPGRLQLSSINTNSHPNLSLAQSAAFARKASLNALTASQHDSPPSPPKMLGGDGRQIETGDLVDVPGSMHGVVKFIGPVRGKKGIFAGVELSKEYAVRGKNDGDVDG
jgi:adenylate cyclase associated (CAP) protein